jgi:hypothetical protein
MRPPLLILPLLIAFVMVVAAQGFAEGWRRVVSSRCGLVLHVPDGWVVRAVKWQFGTTADCAVGLRPPKWLAFRDESALDISEFAIYVGVSAGTLETACTKRIVCHDSRGWHFEGRAGVRSPGHEVKTTVGRGIRGEVETGAYRKEEGYVGASGTLMGVLNSERRLAQFIADNRFRDESIFTRIFETFEFR